MATPIPNLFEGPHQCFYYPEGTPVEAGASLLSNATYEGHRVYYMPVASAAGFSLMSILPPWGLFSPPPPPASRPDGKLTLDNIRSMKQQWAARMLQLGERTDRPYTIDQVREAANLEGRTIGKYYNHIKQGCLECGLTFHGEVWQDVITDEYYIKKGGSGHGWHAEPSTQQKASWFEISAERNKRITELTPAGRRRKSSKSTKKHRNHSHKQK